MPRSCAGQGRKVVILHYKRIACEKAISGSAIIGWGILAGTGINGTKVNETMEKLVDLEI